MCYGGVRIGSAGGGGIAGGMMIGDGGGMLWCGVNGGRSGRGGRKSVRLDRCFGEMVAVMAVA